MKHGYDDEQINDASRTATNYGSCGELHSNYLRRFLAALPDQPYEWEECTFDQIRKGDRVKRVKPVIGDAMETIEGTAVTVDANWALTKGGRPLARSRDINKPDITLYRIPTPVVHPDPAEHPIIMEQGGKGWVWNAQHEMYYQPHSTEYRFPEGFTEWFPAQIISDEPAEAPR